MLYIPASFRDTDRDRLHRFMHEHPFATVVSGCAGLRISHVPLLLDTGRGGSGTLTGHLARANPQWQDFASGQPVVCVFHGPHAYVSSAWYAQQPAVPTWNYAVVHATGVARLIEEPEQVLAQMQATLERFDPAIQDPDARGHPPHDYVQSLLPHIVGFEIDIETLEGAFKLGQNRSLADQDGIAEGLRERDGPDSPLLHLMQAGRSFGK